MDLMEAFRKDIDRSWKYDPKDCPHENVVDHEGFGSEKGDEICTGCGKEWSRRERRS